MPLTPTQNPGPKRDVQSWIATRVRPEISSEVPSAPMDAGQVVAQRDDGEQADRADPDDRRLDCARGDVAEREGFAVSPEDRKHHDRRADVADHQEDLEQGAQRDARVVAGAEDVVGVVEHRVIENERGGDRRQKRRGHQPAGDTSGPSLLRRLL